MCCCLRWLLDKLFPGNDIQTRTAIKELNKTLKKNEKLLEALRKKASQELKNAQELNNRGEEMTAKLHLEMRRQYEESIEKLGKLQFLIKKELLVLEEKRARNETVVALNIGVAARQEMQNPKYIGDKYETNETIARLTQNQDSLRTTPVAASENKLEAPPEEQEQLLQPTTTAPPALVHIPTSPCPAYPVPQRTAKEDVPAASQAEVAR